MALSILSSDSETSRMLSLAQAGHMDKTDAGTASRIFRDKDADGSGGLSLEEMGGNQALFDAFDTNKDGVVSPAELQQGLKKIRETAKGRADAELEQSAGLSRAQGAQDQDGHGAAEVSASETAPKAAQLAAYSRQSQSADLSAPSLLRTLV